MDRNFYKVTQTKITTKKNEKAKSIISKAIKF